MRGRPELFLRFISETPYKNELLIKIRRGAGPEVLFFCEAKNNTVDIFKNSELIN